jgi:sulfite exporter TauE/SafE
MFLPMLGLGLVTSFHCVAMCGALVMTYAVKDGADGTLARRLVPHAAYQTAKIVSYMLVGLVLGAIGAAFDIAGVRGWVMLVAGLFMVMLGLNMTGRFPLLRHLTLKPPRFLVSALAVNRRKARSEASAGRVSLATPLIFGALTGLMPCGPLQAAQLSAASAGSALAGAVSMLGFGLGTAPLMVAFGVGSGYLGSAFKRRMNLVAAIVVIVLGLVIFNRGSMLVGSPITFQSARQVVAGAPAQQPSGYREGADGVAEVDLVIENIRFMPEVLSIPADRSVRVYVDRREGNACSDQLAVPQLGVLVDLAPFDTTVVELSAVPQGTYTLTCGMGMMSGQLVSGAAQPGITGSLWVGAVVLVVFAAVIWYAFTRRASRLGAACPNGPNEAAAPAQGRIAGFTPAELLVIGAGLIAAVIAGLLLGGGVIG